MLNYILVYLGHWATPCVFRFNDTPHLHHHCSGVMFSWGRGTIRLENLVTQHRERSSKNEWIWLTQGSWGKLLLTGFTWDDSYGSFETLLRANWVLQVNRNMRCKLIIVKITPGAAVKHTHTHKKRIFVTRHLHFNLFYRCLYYKAYGPMLKLESFQFVERGRESFLAWEMSQRPTCSYMCARYVGEKDSHLAHPLRCHRLLWRHPSNWFTNKNKNEKH